MRKKLTQKTIENLSIPKAKRIEYWDELLSGFGIRISPTGRKIWFAVGRVKGKQIRHTIGTFPIISLADAREEARKVLSAMQLGRYYEEFYPAPPPKPLTLGDVIPEFIEKYAKPKLRSWRSSQNSLKYFDKLKNMPIDEIRRKDIARVLDDILAKGTPYAANRALATIRKLYSWCLDRGYVDTHPVMGFKPPAKETSRDRVLNDKEVIAFWNALCCVDAVFVPYYKFLLLTGQRRGEVATMKWSQIDFDRMIWTIPASTAKNKRVHEVPLTEYLVDLLRAIPRFLNSDYVFTTTGKSPISGFSKTVRSIQVEMGTFDWRVHDLRRTCASGMARLSVLPHVIEKALNHVSGQISGVAAIYNRHGYEAEKREAIERWEKHVRKIVLSGSSQKNSRSDNSEVKGFSGVI